MPDWGPLEQIVAHGVPLGVSQFDFVRCARSTGIVLGAQRLARLDRLARAGLKQSRRTRLPAMRSSASLEEAVAAALEGTRLVANPDAAGTGFPPSDEVQGSFSLAVGPPGGFSAEEYEFLRRERFQPISLGPSRLTTETASIALIGLARNALQSTDLRVH